VQVKEAPNEAAFYGPKIDIQMWNVNGKEDTAFTVQYDLVMSKRFKLTYTNEQGNEEEPIVIHRSSVGAIERIIAFLIEKYAGAFPLWLSPIQIALIPIADRHHGAVYKAAQQLKASGIRVEVDDRAESMQAKIRFATLQKVPYMGIIGDKELEQDKIHVSVRTREGKNMGSGPILELLRKLKEEIETKVH
jgi:threonyl-tRNA synthetase